MHAEQQLLTRTSQLVSPTQRHSPVISLKRNIKQNKNASNRRILDSSKLLAVQTRTSLNVMVKQNNAMHVNLVDSTGGQSVTGRGEYGG